MCDNNNYRCILTRPYRIQFQCLIIRKKPFLTLSYKLNINYIRTKLQVHYAHAHVDDFTNTPNQNNNSFGLTDILTRSNGLNFDQFVTSI